MKKSAFLNSCLVFVSLCLALVISEVILRHSGIVPEIAYIEKGQERLASNPKIGWESIPYSSSKDSPEPRNDLGFRDRRHDVYKKPGTYRIVILGDSVADGIWIEKNRDTFPGRLEQFFLDRAQHVEVLNFSASGYNTMQEVETLKDKALLYQPDLVVLAYCLNDRWEDNGNMYRTLLDEKKHQGVIDRARFPLWVYQSAIFRFLRFNILSKMLPSASSDMDDQDRFTKDRVSEYFGVLKGLADQKGFAVLVIIFPEFTTIEARQSSYPYQDEHDKIRQLSEANNFSFLDLLPGMTKCKESRPNERVAFDKYHLSPNGHICASVETGRFILQYYRL